MHDYLSKTKSSDFHYFVLPIGTVRGKPKSTIGRPRKSDISTLIQYTTKFSTTCKFSTLCSGVYLVGVVVIRSDTCQIINF